MPSLYLRYFRQVLNTHALHAFAAGLVLCMGVLTLGPLNSARATDSGGGLSIQPVSSEPQAGVTNRPTFSYKLDPGAIQSDAVLVSNLNDTPTEVVVYIANAFTTSSGLLGVKANDKAKTGPVDWLKFTSKLRNNTFVLDAKTSATIPFAITIPPNAPPGDYAFGVAVAPVIEATPVPGQNTAQIVQAAATLVELRVTGPLIPIIRVGSLRVTSEAKLLPGFIDGSTKVTFEVVNVGNERINTIISVTEHNAFSGLIHTEPVIKLNNVLPGSRVKLTRSWDNTPYVKGSVTVKISSSSSTSAERSANFWSVSWRTFVVPFILITTILFIRWRLRRRRREKDAQYLAKNFPKGPPTANGSRQSDKPKADSVRS